MLLTLCSLCFQKVEKLKAILHSLDIRPSSKHIYYAEDRFVLDPLSLRDEAVGVKVGTEHSPFPLSLYFSLCKPVELSSLSVFLVFIPVFVSPLCL